MLKVKVSIEVEYEVKDEISARGTLMRIPGDLRNAIEEGKAGRNMTGVKPGTVKVAIVRRSIHKPQPGNVT